MQPLQKIDDGHFAIFENGKEVIGGGFQQFLMPERIEGG